MQYNLNKHDSLIFTTNSNVIVFGNRFSENTSTKEFRLFLIDDENLKNINTVDYDPSRDIPLDTSGNVLKDSSGTLQEAITTFHNYDDIKFTIYIEGKHLRLISLKSDNEINTDQYVTLYKHNLPKITSVETFRKTLRTFPKTSLDTYYRGEKKFHNHIRSSLSQYLDDKSINAEDYYKEIDKLKTDIFIETGIDFPRYDYAALNFTKERFNDFGDLKFLPERDFLIFIRHHGFPTPLIDCTTNPYPLYISH